MRVLLAGASGASGASGAVGRPLTERLLAAGHQVLALTRSPGHAEAVRAAGAVPVVADAMDREGLLRSLDGRAADAVIHQLTALKRPPMRHRGMEQTNRLRTQGTANLLAAAQAVGARRFVTQSIVFGYGYRDHGRRWLTEADPFGVPVPGPLGRHVEAMASNERQALSTPGIDGISLRYGLFYGPGAGTELLVGMLRRRMFPVPRSGGGYASFIYISDAASAAVAALERGRAGQAYNIVDDEPVRWGRFLAGAAEAFGVPRPIRLPGTLLRVLPYVHALLHTSLRVSNGTAREQLGWAPRVGTYRDGLRLTAAHVAGRQ